MINRDKSTFLNLYVGGTKGQITAVFISDWKMWRNKEKPQNVASYLR